MGGSIYGTGVTTITFNDDLYWMTENQSDSMLTERRALDGTIVQSKLTSLATKRDYYHKFKFTWVPKATLDALYALKNAGTTFNVKTSSSATAIGPCRFARSAPITAKPVPPEEFFSPDAVEGTDLDLYNGELHLIVRM